MLRQIAFVNEINDSVPRWCEEVRKRNLNQLNFTFSDPRYIEMIRAKDEEQVKEIARLIKENKPLPDKKKKNKA